MTQNLISPKLTLTASVTALGLLVSACGLSPAAEPLRTSGPVSVSYNNDLVECRQIAAQYDTEMTSEGAIAGALLGAAVGATESHEDAIAGAAVGGLLGAAEGKIEQEEKQREMIIRCMQNRDHPVIG
ncbi:glycine zipper domain-containing protein [Phaeobacter sp. 11ANDIMAR09]|uniref:glycine zipper domain-containing protein n=1 Tax=Phaeobacter sp. 11ANDIMAR09 TaxID=1225647 RepID=UPI0006D6D324|nr:glycine zipper domain-containing protein [Phaeobacter sp. 11ANDIMAR09]KPD12452.1 hypothetical protein AN476_10790 [Phaeobacter sp. 11ANDIMAR09]